MRLVSSVLGVLTAAAIIVVAAFYVSPWPSVWVIREIFDAGAEKASAGLETHVPANLKSQLDISYDDKVPGARLDIYAGENAQADGPVIVWFHGGGFVSGRRSDLTNYVKVLAGRGFTVVNVDYTIAPEATYPSPIRQANSALAFLDRNAADLGLGGGDFVLAGDSAGAQIAAQTAATIVNGDYAREVGITPGLNADRLAGALLYCGVYDIAGMGQGGGILGWFVGSVKWAYAGVRGAEADRRLATMSVLAAIESDFPPAFISAGNDDPLGPQSLALAEALKNKGIEVTTRFYPPDHQPPLGHEYQFDFTIKDARDALDDSVLWLSGL